MSAASVHGDDVSKVAAAAATILLADFRQRLRRSCKLSAGSGRGDDLSEAAALAAAATMILLVECRKRPRR